MIPTAPPGSSSIAAGGISVLVRAFRERRFSTRRDWRSPRGGRARRGAEAPRGFNKMAHRPQRKVMFAFVHAAGCLLPPRAVVRLPRQKLAGRGESEWVGGPRRSRFFLVFFRVGLRSALLKSDGGVGRWIHLYLRGSLWFVRLGKT